VAHGERTLAVNRKARHDYVIHDTYEAGLVLTGAEIKSIRAGQVNLRDSYVTIRDGEAWLVGMHVAPYRHASTHHSYEAKRDRKLLLHRREIMRLQGQSQEKGFTIVPLRLYLKRNRAKIEIALARGKKLYDKREALRKKETAREIERSLHRRW
jgi:SsrA-binding protein